jgi:hypothetical protein
VKGSSPLLLAAGETRLTRAPFTCCALTCCAGACCSSGVLTGGAETEEGCDPPDELAGEPPLPEDVPDEPGFVVVPGVVVVVSFVVVVSLVVVVSVVGVVSVVVVSAWLQWSSLPLAFP